MLKRVKIQGYKSLEDVEVHLQPLSVLFGPNASGKSNFLDALQLLSRIATSNKLNLAFRPPYRGTPFESFTFGSNGIQDILTKEKVSFYIEIDFDLSQQVMDSVNRTVFTDSANSLDPDTAYVQNAHLRYGIEIEAHPKTGTFTVSHELLAHLSERGEITDKHPILEWRNSTLLWGQQNRNPVAGEIDFSFLALPYYPPHHPYLVATRQELASWAFYYLEPRERMRIIDPLREVRSIGPMGEELAAFLHTLKASDQKQFRALEKAMSMIVPSITGIDTSLNNFGEIELRLLENGKPISARVVSEGTLRVLGLLAISSTKDETTLLGLEEPENGIHPRRIRLIKSLLETRARHDTQVIVATHSPILVDLIPSDSLYVCRKVAGKTAIEPYSIWEYPDLRAALDDEEEFQLPELTVSERILRGDFDAED
jgi:predicted ATPase